MTDQGPLTMQGVEMPLLFAHNLADFVTPDWVTVIEFYPEFCKRVVARGNSLEEPWDPQPYMLMFAKELERGKAREGRTADDWMQRLMEHFGLGWMT